MAQNCKPGFNVNLCASIAQIKQNIASFFPNNGHGPTRPCINRGDNPLLKNVFNFPDNFNTQLTLMFWNGGGCMSSRLRTNPELKLLFSSNPDVFVYAESLLYSKSKYRSQNALPGYDSFHLTADRKSGRRGISVFYLRKHRFTMSKDHVSAKYDIIWAKLENKNDKAVFCFFYAPGVNKTAIDRVGFYDELREGYKKYSNKYNVFLLGDSNARLGSYSQDKGINGKYISNNNKSLFLGFLEYSALNYLNAIYAKGKPTYEITDRKMSIIDVGLTNNISCIHDFEVLPNILGVNPQTCHKVLKLTLDFVHSKQGLNKIHYTGKFRYCSENSLYKIRDWVSDRMGELVSLRPDDSSIYQYNVLKRMYEFAKTKFLGLAHKNVMKTIVSHKVNKLQLYVKYYTALYSRNSSDVNLTKLRLAHKQLIETWQTEKQKNFTQWLAKLDKLSYQQATRSFFSELKNKTTNPEVFGPIENSDGHISKSLPECLKNWSDFYSQLYKPHPKTLQFLSSNFPKFRPITHEDLHDLNKPICIAELLLAINKFKNYCSPGADMILNRDFTSLLVAVQKGQYRWEVPEFLHKLLNKFWNDEKVPESFKESIIRPFLKPGKNPCKRKNYRPISLLNVPMKLYEQLIKHRLVRFLEESSFFSKAQAAYRTGCSTVDNLLVLQEIFFYYRYVKKGPRGATGKQPLYLAFLDLRKAFDSVPRYLLFKKLSHIGIRGKLFNVLKDLYTKNKARVRIGQKFSAYFEINSGVMQGSKLGPILFIFYINDLLHSLNDSSLGAHVGDVVVSALGFADDIILISDNPEKLQKLIDICSLWATRNGMGFNTDKCKILTLNTKGKDLIFNLSSDYLEKVEMIKYLGVVFSNVRLTSLYTRHFKRVIDKAEKRINCIRHFGFDSDGLRPVTCIRMYKILVRPILEYAAQILSYRHYYFTEKLKRNNLGEPTDFLLKLEHFQNRTLKLLIPCPKSTPPCILRLFTGTIPLAAHIDILKLRYFWKLTHSTRKSFALDIYKFKRGRFLESNIGYTHEIFNICCKYNILWVWHGIWNSMKTPKENPLARIKREIVRYHLKKDIEAAKKINCIYTSLFLLGKKYGNKYRFEKFFESFGVFKNTEYRRFFLYSLFDTCAYSRKCPKCNSAVNDILKHTLTDCIKMNRMRMLLTVKLLLFKATNQVPPNKLTCKTTLYSLALHNQLYRKALCEFLISVGYYCTN